MTKKKKEPLTKAQLLSENSELKIRLRELEETLEAIRSGSVDAVVVSGDTGEQIYTLQGADEPYRLLVESINEGTVTMSMDGTILYCNKQFADMLGYPLEKVIGASFLNFLSHEDRHHMEEALRDRLKCVPRFQARLSSREWGDIPAQITLGVADGSFADKLTAVITDLSAQVRYQDIVREEKLSRSIIENALDGIAVCDAKGVVIRASRTLNEFCGCSTLKMPFDEVFRIEVLSDNQPPATFSSRDILSGKTVRDVEARLYCPDKEVYDINLNAVPLQNDERVTIGCLITIKDVTKRKQAEEALQIAHQLLQYTIVNMHSSVLFVRESGIELANQACCDYFDIEGPPAGLVGLLPSAMLEKVSNAHVHHEKEVIRIQEILAAGQPVIGEEIAIKGGRTYLRDFIPIWIDGTLFGRLWNHTDITELKKAEIELQKSEHRYRELFNSMQEGFYIAEIIYDESGQPQDYRYLDVNPALAEIMGLPRDQIIGKLRSELNSIPTPQWMHTFKTVAVTGIPAYKEFYSNRYGRYLKTTSSRPYEGQIAVLVEDITERKKAEEALNQQSSKLEAANKDLETFAYSVSHDLRAPLRAIEGFSRMLQSKMAGKMNEDEKRQFEVIRNSTKQMGKLIDDVLAFSRLGRQSMSFVNINMTEMAKDVWDELLTINPGRSMSLKMNSLPTAFGDNATIRQVLANLLSNAVKFTRMKEAALIELGGDVMDSETVYYVRDNGAGFDMKYADKLFRVFQRLHSAEEYEGTGAGLAIAYRIINRHGGRIWAESETDKGATFYFSLPRE